MQKWFHLKSVRSGHTARWSISLSQSLYVFSTLKRWGKTRCLLSEWYAIVTVCVVSVCVILSVGEVIITNC